MGELVEVRIEERTHVVKSVLSSSYTNSSSSKMITLDILDRSGSLLSFSCSSSSSMVTPLDIVIDQQEHLVEGPILSLSYSNSSSKVTPLDVLDQQEHVEEGDSNKSSPSPQQVEAWLPITESRKSNLLTTLFHLISSGIGIQTLVIPYAFIKLGWYWGIISLALIYVWQLYTTWILVNLHESSDGLSRYSRYLHLSVVAFGNKLAKMFVLFPVLYLSSGTCTIFTIIGGATMEQLYKIICDGSGSKCNVLTRAEWFLMFICLAIIVALFFPNMNSLARVSLVGSIAAISYCIMIWTLSIGKGNKVNKGAPSNIPHEYTSGTTHFRDVVSALGVIASSFRGHNLILEIQGTIPTNGEHRSKKIMWRGVTISYAIIALCLFPIAIVGYWAYGDDEIPTIGGILSAYTKSHQQSTSKWLLATIYLLVLIHYLSAFQLYAMPVFDNWERIYITIKNQPCPKLTRLAIKLLYGGILYFLAVAVPFLPILGAFVGGFALPLTFSFPCFMWISIKIKKRNHSTRTLTMWFLNMVLGSFGLVLSLVVVIGALSNLVLNGMHANFFNP
ncbi:hypothetical protein LIER_14777 [Lithospermum erythrorhizon]|uniref:Amino acid transporter transmembrane domain-containing protein n=1 Tax=Lithospermum erythrorhizon TaxID=34254 RepID=A0AAV3Q0R4_LITER